MFFKGDVITIAQKCGSRLHQAGLETSLASGGYFSTRFIQAGSVARKGDQRLSSHLYSRSKVAGLSWILIKVGTRISCA